MINLSTRTDPSHSQTSRLVSSSCFLGIPFPHQILTRIDSHTPSPGVLPLTNLSSRLHFPLLRFPLPPLQLVCVKSHVTGTYFNCN